MRAGGLILTLMVLAGPPVFAQRDLAGEWAALYHEDQPHRLPGPELGDYTGLPINDAGRLKADSWDASILTLREHQAKPHPSTYSLRGPANIRIRRELDPVRRRACCGLTAVRIHLLMPRTRGQASRRRNGTVTRSRCSPRI